MQQRELPIQVHLASVPRPQKEPPAQLCQQRPTWSHITCVQGESPAPLQAWFHPVSQPQLRLSLAQNIPGFTNIPQRATLLHLFGNR